MMVRQVCLLALLAVFVGLCSGHARFVCPRPESPNSGIKFGPCSSGSTDTPPDFQVKYTDITPGPLTIYFEETIFHRGAPTMFTLNRFGDVNNTCLLLDHVPHNERPGPVIDITPECNVFSWPLGRCWNSSHYVTLNIPDIECDNCYLQLVSLMLDKYTPEQMPCVRINQGLTNCSTYYSCAYVRIRPTAQGRGKGIDTCTNYRSNLMGQWPYRPRDQYKSAVKKTGESEVQLTADFLFDTYDDSLSYNFTRPASGYESAGIYTSEQGEKLHNIPLGSEEKVEGRWEELSSEQQTLLKTGQLSLRFTHSDSAQDLSGAINLAVEPHQMRAWTSVPPLADIYKPYIYYDHYMYFTKKGWMSGDDFVGTTATYPWALKPTGPCMPETHHFGSSLTMTTGASSPGDVQPYGVVSMTVTEAHAWISGTFLGLTGEITELVLSSNDNNGAQPIVVTEQKVFEGGRITLMINVTRQIQYLGTDKFLNKITVKTAQNPKGELDGTFSDAVVASLTSSGNYLDYKGEAVFFLQPHGSVQYAMAMKSSEAPTSITLNGPARQSQVGGAIGNLNFRAVWSGEYKADGNWDFSEVADALFYLWSGELYVDVRTPSTTTDRGVNGQLPKTMGQPIMQKLCQQAENMCNVALISVDEEDVDRGWETVDTNGAVSVVVYEKDGATDLGYAISLRDIEDGETVSRVEISGGNSTVRVEGSTFTPSQIEDKVLITKGVISRVPSDVVSALAAGSAKLKVWTSRFSEGTLSATLPKITLKPKE